MSKPKPYSIKESNLHYVYQRFRYGEGKIRLQEFDKGNPIQLPFVKEGSGWKLDIEDFPMTFDHLYMTRETNKFLNSLLGKSKKISFETYSEKPIKPYVELYLIEEDSTQGRRYKASYSKDNEVSTISFKSIFLYLFDRYPEKLYLKFK